MKILRHDKYIAVIQVLPSLHVIVSPGSQTGVTVLTPSGPRVLDLETPTATLATAYADERSAGVKFDEGTVVNLNEVSRDLRLEVDHPAKPIKGWTLPFPVLGLTDGPYTVQLSLEYDDAETPEDAARQFFNDFHAGLDYTVDVLNNSGKKVLTCDRSELEEEV